jgi:predicted nucleic acid-binding Zn ribbon protein
VTCPECGKGFSNDCRSCRERSYRLTPLILIDTDHQFPGTRHRLVWDSPLMEHLYCELCGKPIPPEMTMAELFAPCSGGRVVSGSEVPP